MTPHDLEHHYSCCSVSQAKRLPEEVTLTSVLSALLPLPFRKETGTTLYLLQRCKMQKIERWIDDSKD